MVSNKSSKFSLKSSTGFKVVVVSLLGVSQLAGIAAQTVLNLSNAYNASAATSDENTNKMQPLADAIAKAESFQKTYDKYPSYFNKDNVEELLKDMDSAKQTVKDDKITAEEAKNVADKINRWLDGKDIWKDEGAKTQLDSEMALAAELGEDKLDASAYTKESYSAYSKAYDAAKTVYDENVEYKGNNGAAAKDIDAATETLKKAVAALVKVSDIEGDNNSGSNSGNSENGNQTGDADNSGNSNIEVTTPSASNNNASESKVTAPNTGAEL